MTYIQSDIWRIANKRPPYWIHTVWLSVSHRHVIQGLRYLDNNSTLTLGPNCSSQYTQHRNNKYISNTSFTMGCMYIRKFWRYTYHLFNMDTFCNMSGIKRNKLGKFYTMALIELWFKWWYMLRHCFLVFFLKRMPCKYNSPTWNWGTWFCENLIIFNVHEFMFIYTVASVYNFQDTLQFLQRHICIILHMIITFHVFENFDSVPQYYGHPNCILKYSTRKCMLYYWKLCKL